jgi:hypothetical protein
LAGQRVVFTSRKLSRRSAAGAKADYWGSRATAWQANAHHRARTLQRPSEGRVVF